ncbi:MAG TPA: helix-turn-helix domain-containing protein [Stellaceae bacterium]|nr:helix-turn-helix domain-containing protein [Stellaceae bacterium]
MSAVAAKTYSVEEAARLLGIGRNHAYEAAKRGDIPCIKIGKRVLVPKAALDRLLDGKTAA